MTLADLRAYFLVPNVRAFSHVVRARETNQEAGAYTLINGGAHFGGGCQGRARLNFAGRRIEDVA